MNSEFGRGKLLISAVSCLLFVSACSINQSPRFSSTPTSARVESAIATGTITAPTRIIPTATLNLSASPGTFATPTAVQPISSFPELPIDPATGWKRYTYLTDKLSFEFPATWYGPDELVWGQGVTIYVASDKLYPYGTELTDRVYELKDSYVVRVQYVKNATQLTWEQYRVNQPWVETYESLLKRADGEFESGLRSLDIRVRKLRLGRFEGLEYIETLSETAQTEPIYDRWAVLFDADLNCLTLVGSPNNVEIVQGNWREAYMRVDHAFLDTFHQIIESVMME